MAANRRLYDEFKASGGQLKVLRNQEMPDVDGRMMFGGYSAKKNAIYLFKGSNLGTLSEELIHFKQIKEYGLLYKEVDLETLLPGPWGKRMTLRDILEEHAQIVLTQWGYKRIK